MAREKTEELIQRLSQEPRNWSLRLEAAERLIQEGHSGQAVSILDAAEDPPEFESEIMKAAELYSGVAPGKAVPLIHAFLEVRPESALGHLAMAEVAGRMKDTSSASEYYRCAIELNPNYRDPEFEARFGIRYVDTPMSAPDPTPPSPLPPSPEPDVPEESAAGSDKPSGRRRKKSGAGGCLIMAGFALISFLIAWLVFLAVMKVVWAG